LVPALLAPPLHPPCCASRTQQRYGPEPRLLDTHLQALLAYVERQFHTAEGGGNQLYLREGFRDGDDLTLVTDVSQLIRRGRHASCMCVRVRKKAQHRRSACCAGTLAHAPRHRFTRCGGPNGMMTEQDKEAIYRILERKRKSMEY
jgi:hypothetical protein